MTSRQVVVCADAGGVARAAARHFVAAAQRAIHERGRFCVALSGGSTPAQMYRRLATDEFRRQVPWSAAWMFWSDERAVAPAHPASNYGLAHRELISRVAIPPGQIIRMEAERGDLEAAAADYENLLRRHVPADPTARLPSLDLILLGMGADGHIASLFPSAPELTETARLVCATREERAGWRRLTFTLPLINAAGKVVFLLTGKEKAATLREVLEGDRDALIPASRVSPTSGELLFVVDREAAALLGTH